MLELISMVVGALVGAGFASGRELATFFVAFGPDGFKGILIMTALFGASGLLVVFLCRELEVDSYQALLSKIFPEKSAKFFAFLISVGLWLGLGLMMTGCGTLGTLLFGWQPAVGFIAAFVGVFLPLKQGGEGFLKLNGYLLPVLVVLVLVTCLAFLNQPVGCAAALSLEMLLPSWHVAAVLYWLYNLLLAIAMLVSVRRKRHVLRAVVLATGVIGLLAFLLCFCLALLPDALQKSQMPMLLLAQSMGPVFGYGYGLVMILAMYTTALANCYGLLVNYQEYFKKRTTLLWLILLPTAAFGPFNFGQLVALIYPLLGYASVPIMAAMICQGMRLMGGKLWNLMKK